MTTGTLESVLESKCESETLSSACSAAAWIQQEYCDCGNTISQNAVCENQDSAVQNTEHRKHTQNNVFCEL